MREKGELLRVLVVDDNAPVLEFLVEAFTANRCLVASAATAEEALDLLSDRPVDLLVADIRLPGLSGLDLLRAAHGKQPGVSVVLITGQPSVTSAVFGVRHRAYDYLSKPVALKDVQALLERLRTDRAHRGSPEREPPGRGADPGLRELAMEGLFRIGESAFQGLEADGFLDVALDYAVQGLQSEAVLLLLEDHQGQTIQRQKGDRAVSSQLLGLVESAFDELGRTGGQEPLTLTDAGQPVAALAALLPDAGAVRGVLCAGRDARRGAFLPHERTFFRHYAQAIALGLRNVLLDKNLESNLADTISFFVTALESKDPSLKGHSARVSLYAGEIARALDLAPADVTVCRRAGLLHDLGKLVLVDAILLKPGPLTPEEAAVVRQHPVIGARILQRLGFLEHEAEAVRHHLERFDGGGAPDGLAGEEIPLAARVVAVADAFDAMMSFRPYRPARSLPAALAELIRKGRVQFDPAVVRAFTTVPEARLVEISRYYGNADAAAERPTRPDGDSSPRGTGGERALPAGDRLPHAGPARNESPVGADLLVVRRPGDPLEPLKRAIRGELAGSG